MKRRHLSGLGTAFPREKAIFEAWERWVAEIAGLGTAFPCVPAYFNTCGGAQTNSLLVLECEKV